MSGVLVVTGASGFVGSHLVRRLADDGVAFRALVRTNAQMEPVRRLGGEPFEGDLERSDTLRGLLDGADVVCHCAGKVDLWGPLEAFRSVNADGLAALLRECERAATRPRFVHLSTASVHHEPLPAMACEALPLADSDEPYVASKVEAEWLVRRAHVENVVAATVLRPVHVYGPRSQIVTETAQRIRSGRRTLIDFPDGTMPVVFVENLVAAILCAARASSADGSAYFVTDDEETTWNAFVETLARNAALPLNRRKIPPQAALLAAAVLERAYALAGVRRRPPIVRSFLRMIALRTRFTSERAKRELGFRPRHDFAAGMRETGRWLLEHTKERGYTCHMP